MSWVRSKRSGKAQWYRVLGDVSEIQLTQGQVALIDTVDLEQVLKYKCFAQHTFENTYYALCGNGKICKSNPAIRLHRLLLGVTDPDIEVDHINGDRMNNTRTNIKLADRKVNQNNRKTNSNNKTTGINGICDDVKEHRYRVSWMAQGKLKKKSFGYYKKEKLDSLAEAIVFRTLRDVENDCTNGIRPK